MDDLLPPWMIDYLPAIPGRRYKIARGGRGSGKSWAFARMAVLRTAPLPYNRPLRFLCARELQNTMRESVHQLIVDQIQVMGMQGLYKVNDSSIRSANGSEFMFRGLRGIKNDASALKSLEGVDVCWLEEGQTVSDASLQTLTPTIRKKNAEIWITYNPDLPSDPVDRLACDPPDGSLVKTINWYDNPWFYETSLDVERAWMQRTDPQAYAHVWEGGYREFSDAQVFKDKYVVDYFTPSSGWDGPYFGADWGFNPDPTTLVKCWIAHDRLYVEFEAYKIECELDDIGALFDTVPGSRQRVIRADSSRPDTIRHVRKQGFNVVPAKKGEGSIEDGISYIRSFDTVVIHPRCKHTAEEARLYSHKVDKRSGEVLPDIEDKHNHCWDAIRYSLEPMIKGRDAGYATSIRRRLI